MAGTDPNGSNPDAGGNQARRQSPVRALDPATARRLVDGGYARPTLYLTDRLLVRDLDTSPTRDLDNPFDRALGTLNLTFDTTPRKRRGGEEGQGGEESGGTRGSGGGRRSADQPTGLGPVTSITLRSTESSTEPVDAWDALQQLRAAATTADDAETRSLADRVSLEHILRPAPHWGGIGGFWGGIGGFWGGIGGFWGGIGGFWGGIGGFWGAAGGQGSESSTAAAAAISEYGVPGLGGRLPVSVVLPDPALRVKDSRKKLARQPVVAFLDTGVARHPWFEDPAGIERLELDEGRLVTEVVDGVQPVIADAATTVPGRPPLEGHGTFIAGLIRQVCPEARILSVTVMGDDGVAEEGDILDALEALLARHVAARKRGGDKSQAVDVLSLSLGYYPEDGTYTHGPVADVLGRIRAEGVLVVAGVGNDGSSAPFVPAALAASLDDRLDAPVVSVGAYNPNGTSIAYFSNDLPQVNYIRPGVSVVSTLPLTNGSSVPSSSTPGGAGRMRTTVDFDDYTGGFGVWSGTSFSTPILAAQLACELVAARDIASVTGTAMLTRAEAALVACRSDRPEGVSS